MDHPLSPLEPNQVLAVCRLLLGYFTDPADLHEAREAGTPDLVVLDARTPERYREAHITGAVSFPYRQMSEEALAGLDPAKVYVVYGDGIGCNAATKAALRLASKGFLVKELIGGVDWWMVRDRLPVASG